MTLDRLLNPRSVALVGASADPKKISGMMVEFLRRSGFAGRVLPVNPRYEAIGEWTCFPSVEALPETPDVVVIAVPVAIAFEPLEQAAARGVPFVVLMTGGFGEGTSGEEGQRRLARLRELCDRSGMRVLGPNTVGMVNFRGRMPLTFADWYGRDTGQRGGVAILTHSGSVGGLIFSSLQANKVGVDYWIASGNEAVLEVADFIDHLADDPQLTTIACFIEGVVDGRKFMMAAQKARAAGKRIVVLKAGESEASLRSTTAHTIKRSTHPAVYRAAFAQLGIVQVRSLQELTYCVKLLSTAGDRIGGRVGILSASGGACSLIADHVVEAGLELPELAPDVQRELEKFIPDYGSTRNPVDLSADVVSRRDIIDGSFATLERETLVDNWLVFGRPVIDRYHAEIRAFSDRSNKAVIVSSGVAMKPEVEAELTAAGVPVLDDPQLCMRALGAVHRAQERAGRERDWRIERRTSRMRIDDAEAESIAAKYGVQPDRSKPASVRPFHFVLGDDPDFGPILAAHLDGSSSRDASRIVRLLPLDDDDIAAFASEWAASAGSESGSAREAVAGLARALYALYGSERGVAGIEVEVVVDRSTVAVTRIAMDRTA